MNTKKSRMMTLTTLTALGTLLGSALAQAHEVGNTKIVELTLHRIDRLVILKKIEESFLSKLKSLKLEALPHQTEDEPSFKVTAYQYLGGDGTQKSLEIVLNQEGKALSSLAKSGADAVGAPTFGEKDAVTLAENSLHWVEDAATTRPEIATFNQGLTQLTIAAGSNSAGNAVAVIDLQAGPFPSILRVRIKFDGTFDSADIIPQAQ